MKKLSVILEEKKQLLKTYQERIPENNRTWMNAEWRPVSGLPGVIESINELLPYERGLSEILGENEILKIGKTICRAGNFIEIVSTSKEGVYNYKYFQLENGQLKMAYDFGTCESGFYQNVVSPVKYVLVDGVWRDEEIGKEAGKNKKYTVTFCSYTFHYDNDESRELECNFPETAALDELTEYAKSICEMAARNDDYFKTMEMKEEPFVSVNEEDGFIDVTFDFSEGDFVTDIRVSYSVNTSTLVRVKDVEFVLLNPQDGTLEISAQVQGDEVGYCFVNKDGEYFGHNGKLATGFDDNEVEKVAQEVFVKEINEWLEK